jgi:hypothetical protein
VRWTRESKRSRLNSATQKTEAGRERESLRVARAEFEAQREGLLKKVADEAEIMRKRLADEVRQEIETVRAKWRETLRHEQDALRSELTNRAQREIFAIARQTLSDLAGKELEEQIATVFVRRLNALNGDEKDQLASILKRHASRWSSGVRLIYANPGVPKSKTRSQKRWFLTYRYDLRPHQTWLAASSWLQTVTRFHGA